MRAVFAILLRLLDGLETLVSRIAAGTVIALVLWVTFAVVMRYIFNNPLSIAIDTSVIMLMIILFLPLALALKDDMHPTIGLLTERFSRTWQHIIHIFGLVATILVAGMWTVWFWQDMTKMLDYRVRIEMMPFIRVGLVRIPMIIGMGLFLLFLLAYLALSIKNFAQRRKLDFSPDLRLEVLGEKTKDSG